MSIDAADAAIDAAVDNLTTATSEAGGEPENLPATDGAVDGVVTRSADAPCSAEEARELIQKAITAANSFQSAVGELLARDAHIALGYASGREMIVREFSGTVINPRTNKPITDNYLHRMARVAMLLWHVADITGHDAADLRLPEHALRQVSRADGGVNDVDTIDLVSERLQQLDNPSADEVNDVLEDTVRDMGRRNKNPEPVDSVPDDDTTDDSHEGEPSGGRPTDRADRPNPTAHPRDNSAADNDGGFESDDASGGDAADRSDSDSPSGPAPSVAGAFDIALPDDFDAQISELDTASALQHMRKAGDVRRVLRDIQRIYELLPTLVEVKKQVPHIIDAIEDAELDALKAELDGADNSVDWAAQARAVIVDALGEVRIRYDEAI